MFVESFHSVFKSREFDHGVRNLSHPKWGQTFVETIGTFICFDKAESFSKFGRECSSVGGLHSHFELIIIN